jgi:hypothetical protein
MALTALSEERRQQLLGEASDRIRSGMGMVSEGADQLATATEAEDFDGMRVALGRMREGLTQLESGVATRRAIEEGKSPQEVALTWFKREMSLIPQPETDVRRGPFGLSWSHFFTMAALVLFAAAMIGMYFFKMRRAANLLQSLTGGPPLAVPASVITPMAPAPISTGSPSIVADGTAPKTWSGKLRVSQIFQETPDVKTFRLMNPLGGSIPFQHLPGQFLDHGGPGRQTSPAQLHFGLLAHAA